MISQVYVLHCKALHERRLYLQSKLEELKIPAQWITDFDASELTEEFVNSYYVEDQDECTKRVMPLWPISQHSRRRLWKTEISLVIKFIEALTRIANSDFDAGLVLEDDCLFCENFNDVFDNYLLATPTDWDVIHVGNGYGIHPEKYVSVNNQIAYKMHHPASRCTEAILFKKEAAKSILQTIKPFYMVADWELAYQYYLHNLSVYWWEPAPITQGSHGGVFPTSLGKN